MKRRLSAFSSVGGFSLGEAVMVIAVICVLAALIFPAFPKAMEQVRQIQCASNLRQLGMGMKLYAADNDDWVPYSIDSSGVNTWTAQIAPYVGQPLTPIGTLPTKPYACPSCKYTTYGGSRCHYGKNWHINGYLNSPADQNHNGFRFSAISAPATYYLLADSTVPTGGTSACRDIGNLNRPPTTAKTKYWIEARHDGRANILFCDLHGESLTVSQIPDAAAGMSPWAPKGL